jgi:hypothetical protein
LPDSRVARGLRHFQVARLPTLAVAVMLGVVVFAWSRRLYGPAAGVLSLFLYVFDANILAHSRFITTDLYPRLTSVRLMNSYAAERGGGLLQLLCW